MQEAINNIKPEKVTKPIQLLGAWLLGLILLVIALLTASAKTYELKWLNAFYGISAVLIIPLFLRLIFLLQTKYRPEMQADEFYSEMLKNKYTKDIMTEKYYSLKDYLNKTYRKK